MASPPLTTLEEYCASQIPLDVEALPASTRDFLQRLALPTRHPFCNESYLLASYRAAAIPPEGPLQQQQPLHDTWRDAVVTWFWQYLPPLGAFAELWVRLVAGWVAPILVVYLLLRLPKQQSQSDEGSNPPTKRCRTRKISSYLALLALGCSAIVMTDSNYVLEFGNSYGVFLFGTSLALSLRTSQRNSIGRLLAIAVVLIAAALTWDYDSHRGFHLGTPTDVDIQVPEGLYYDETNPLVRAVVETFWSRHYYTYAPRATRWMLTGDARTGLPFFFNRVHAVDWKRVFLPVPEDGEVLALDMAFPATGYNSSNPVYVILHGMNGGSEEDYCRDLALRQTRVGSTVIVMVSRGLMDLPLAGMNIFRADRVSDAHEAATAIRRAMESDQVLGGVGYSMGAIVLNNYVATYGADCALSAAFSISGALDCRYEMYFRRPQRLWQPMIAEYSRERHLNKWGERMKERLGRDKLVGMMRATNVVALDQYLAVEHYHPRYRNLTEYYESMGALGDIPIDDLESTDVARVASGRVFNVSIPLCVMHALDDPIATWQGVAANHGFLHPQNLVHSGHGNVLLLLTERGGHVGWPTGWLPFQNDWQFMSEAASTFVEAVAEAQHEMQKYRAHLSLSEQIDREGNTSQYVCTVNHSQTAINKERAAEESREGEEPPTSSRFSFCAAATTP